MDCARFGWKPIQASWLFPLLVSGCGNDTRRPREDWNATRDTIGDTVVVRTISGSVWGDTMVALAEVTIGVVDGADEYIFGDIGAVVPAGDGSVWVLDRQVPAIRRYTQDGIYVSSAGRTGHGPGEYTSPTSLGILPDGRLLVLDPGNQRINVYDTAGNNITTWPLPGPILLTQLPLYTDPAGNALAPVLLTGSLPGQGLPIGLARFNPSGQVDTLRPPSWPYQPPQVTAEREGRRSSWGVPFTPQVRWTFSPLGYFVGGLSTEYRIDLFRVAQPVLRIEREWEPVEVTAEERSERERRITDDFRLNFPNWRWNGPPIPDTKPPFVSVGTDAEGRIWVRVPQRAHEHPRALDAGTETRFHEDLVFDVFEPSGRFLGTVAVPHHVQPVPQPWASGHTLWAVTADTMGVQRVVRFRLTPGRTVLGR